MREFKRGDKVEALDANNWRPAILIGEVDEWYLVNFDHSPGSSMLKLKPMVRHQRIRVKMMMQDWIDHSETWAGKNVQVFSAESWHNGPPDLPSYKKGGWRKTGEPYEKEFEVPNE